MKRIIGFLLALSILLTAAAAFASTNKDKDFRKKNHLQGPVRYESNFETFTFGHYEQDNNKDNGPEPIIWIVVEKKDGKMLLWSKDLLDRKQFNETYGPITWEECTLRAWLNDKFMKAAFTAEEQAAILLTDVDNSKAQDNPEYSKTTSGNDTQDYIFLISAAEAVKYFPNFVDRRSAPTDYAIAKGVRSDPAYEIDGRKTGMWWLRSAGPHQWRASMSYFPGTLRYTYATKNIVGVRPMLWVDTGLLPKETE